MFANAQGKGDYALRLTAPDGSAIIDGTTTQQSPYLVQYSCDCSAPPFPAFGNDGPDSTADTNVYSCPSGPSPSPSPSTVTSSTTIPPDQPGYTSTVPQSGTVPGTVIIGTPSPVLTYTTATTPGTRRIPYTVTGTPASSGDPVPVTVYTPTPCLFTSSVSATTVSGATATYTAPACATAVRYTILGGAGGQGPAGGHRNYGGGAGGNIQGTTSITPGQVFTAIAGGEGANDQTPGSGYASGGFGRNGGGGGGGASALYLNGNLLVVAGGGGGGSIAVASSGSTTQSPYDIQYNTNGTSNQGVMGRSTHVTSVGATFDDFLSAGEGASPGTDSQAGAGGIIAGNSTYANSGSAGNEGTGGDGAYNARPDSTTSTAGGGGGGRAGYFGGGGGASNYWVAEHTYIFTSPGNGGGGSNFIGRGANATSKAADNQAPGQVVLIFS
jgi:hypothetical protein